MNRYTIYCTKEQTKKAFELGAPLDGVYRQKNTKIWYTLPPDDPKWQDCAAYYIPTTEQMICLLEEFEAINYIAIYKNKNAWDYRICTTGSRPDITSTYDSFYASRKEATLAAIDATLNYLTNKRHNE